jgi:hypothetical protein
LLLFSLSRQANRRSGRQRSTSPSSTRLALIFPSCQFVSCTVATVTINATASARPVLAGPPVRSLDRRRPTPLLLTANGAVTAVSHAASPGRCCHEWTPHTMASAWRLSWQRRRRPSDRGAFDNGIHPLFGPPSRPNPLSLLGVIRRDAPSIRLLRLSTVDRRRHRPHGAGGVRNSSAPSIGAAPVTSLPNEMFILL